MNPELKHQTRKILEIIIKKSYYINKRYNHHSTFTLLYHEKPLTLKELGSFVRVNDHFLQIDEHYYFINFLYVTEEEAFKASQNLLHKLDKYFENQSSVIAIDGFDTIKTPISVYNRLFDIVNILKKDSSYNRIEDESVL